MKGRVLGSIATVAASVLLTACGSSPEALAAKACEAAAKDRAVGKIMAVDMVVLRKSASADPGGIMQLKAPVTFDTGLQSEYTQTLNCRVQFNGKEATVVSVIFVF